MKLTEKSLLEAVQQMIDTGQTVQPESRVIQYFDKLKQERMKEMGTGVLPELPKL